MTTITVATEDVQAIIREGIELLARAEAFAKRADDAMRTVLARPEGVDYEQHLATPAGQASDLLWDIVSDLQCQGEAITGGGSTSPRGLEVLTQRAEAIRSAL